MGACGTAAWVKSRLGLGAKPRLLTPCCSAAVMLGSIVAFTGCIEHASEADKAAAAHTAAQAAAIRQQQVDEAVAARKGIAAAEGQLAQLPPPAKARYLQVRSMDVWSNPFLIVSRKTITLRVVDPLLADTLPNDALPQNKQHTVGPRKRELTLRLIDLPEALAALPEESWIYGRVVAVEEDPATPKPERPQMRRNVEAVMAMLNDLDVVVDEWPNTPR